MQKVYVDEKKNLETLLWKHYLRNGKMFCLIFKFLLDFTLWKKYPKALFFFTCTTEKLVKFFIKPDLIASPLFIMETILSILQRFKLNLTQNQADIVYASYNGAVFANLLYMAEINDMGWGKKKPKHYIINFKTGVYIFHQKRIFFNIPTAICMCLSWP